VRPPYRLNSNTNQRAASMAVVPSVIPPFKLNSEVQATPGITVMRRISKLEEASQKHLPPLALKQIWLMSLPFRVTQPAIVSSGPVLVAGTGRQLIATHKLRSEQLYAFVASGNISAPLAQFGDTVYVSTMDANFYALDAIRGLSQWSYSTESPVADKPMVLGSDIYLTTIDGQLYRIGREDGISAWKDARGFDRFAADAHRFVAANSRYIYTIDSAGQLSAVGRDRGNRLQRLDTSGFTYSLANDQTDRIYLASNAGTLICIHDRDIPRPIRYARKPAVDETAPPPPGIDVIKPKLPGPKPKEAEKPKEEAKPKEAAKPKDEAKPKEDDKPKDEKPKDDKPKGA